MKLNKLIEKNEKAFEEKFVRDDGLMDKYTDDGDTTASAIKSHLHASQLSIVEWMKEKLEDNLHKYGHPEFCAASGKQYKKCGACIIDDLLQQLNNLQ